MIFRYIHRANHWGSADSVSGPGSGPSDTAVIREVLPGLLNELGVRTMVDVPCGDLAWLRGLDLDLDRYYGYDIVPEIIESLRAEHPMANGVYEAADLVTATLPQADAILCRDVFLHLPHRDIRRALANLKRSGSRYLLASTYTGTENIDLPTGRARPIDLTAPPFSLPAPLRLIDDQAPISPGKHLGVWELRTLPV